MEDTLQYNKIIEFGKYKALVIYPKKYNACAQYPVFIGFSGGNQNINNIDFFNEVYFNSTYLEKYIKVLPVTDNTFSYLELTPQEIKDFVEAIKTKLNALGNGWIAVGTSNGGLVAFNFISSNPKLFSGVLVMPGGIGENIATEEWKHLVIILAHGVKDSVDWKSHAEQTKEKLKNQVNYLAHIELAGAAHIIKRGYSLNHLYKQFFTEIIKS